MRVPVVERTARAVLAWSHTPAAEVLVGRHKLESHRQFLEQAVARCVQKQQVVYSLEDEFLVALTSADKAFGRADAAHGKARQAVMAAKAAFCAARLELRVADGVREEKREAAHAKARAALDAVVKKHAAANAAWERAHRKALHPYAGRRGGDVGLAHYTIAKEVLYRSQTRKAKRHEDWWEGGLELSEYEVVTSQARLDAGRPKNPGKRVGVGGWLYGSTASRHDGVPRERWVALAPDAIDRAASDAYAALQRARVARDAACDLARTQLVRKWHESHGAKAKKRSRPSGDDIELTVRAMVRRRARAETPSPVANLVDSAALQRTYDRMVQFASLTIGKPTAARLAAVYEVLRSSGACVYTRSGQVYAAPTAARPMYRNVADPPSLPSCAFETLPEALRSGDDAAVSLAIKATPSEYHESVETAVAMARWAMANAAAGAPLPRRVVALPDGLCRWSACDEDGNSIEHLSFPLRPYAVVFDPARASFAVCFELLGRFWPETCAAVAVLLQAWQRDADAARVRMEHVSVQQSVVATAAARHTAVLSDPSGVFGSESVGPSLPSPRRTLFDESTRTQRTLRVRPRKLVESPDCIAADVAFCNLMGGSVEVCEWLDESERIWWPVAQNRTPQIWDDASGAWKEAR